MKSRFLILILFSLLLSSCKVIEEARDRKAVGRVLSSPALTDYVMSRAGRTVVPGKTVYIKGETKVITDTISYPVYQRIQEKCPDLDIDSLRKVLADTVYYFRVDTVLVPDTSLIRLYHQEKGRGDNLEGRLEETKGTLAHLEKKMAARGWKHTGIFIVCILVIGFLVFMLIKGK